MSGITLVLDIIPIEKNYWRRDRKIREKAIWL